jgi:Uma2 family endonuclease
MSTTARPVRRSRTLPPAEVGTVKVLSEHVSLIVPPDAHTMSGFRQWATAEEFPEHVRVTFLEGEIIIDMSNEDMEDHVNPKGEITRVVMTLVKASKLGKVYADGLLLTNPEAGVSNNPDALFFTFESLESGRVRPISRRRAAHKYRELEGTPDWVLEVISDSSVQKDTVRLREAYHRSGIPEYWLVDARGEELVFQILVRRKNGYFAAPSQDGWQRSRVFSRWFRLERSVDRGGMLEYTLDLRAE